MLLRMPEQKELSPGSFGITIATVFISVLYVIRIFLHQIRNLIQDQDGLPFLVVIKMPVRKNKTGVMEW